MAKLHFAPTQTSRQNLVNEGVNPDSIVVTGNTVIDALLWARERIEWQDAWREDFKSACQILHEQRPFVLITGHRRENHGDKFYGLCRAIEMLAKSHPEYHFIYPVHLNPNVQKPVYELLSNQPNIHLIAPVGYEQFVFLLNACQMVLTDSGGIQEEAPSLGKPILVMRDNTERPEGIDAGTTKLVGTDPQTIFNSVNELIISEAAYSNMSKAQSPFGDGRASKRIVEALL